MNDHFSVNIGLTGLFCPCVLFGRNVASLNEDVPERSACISHAVCIEGGIALAIATAACSGIDPDTACLLTEGLLFAWWVCGIYAGMGRQLLQRKYHLKVTNYILNLVILKQKQSTTVTKHFLFFVCSICRTHLVIHVWCTAASTGVLYARSIER